MYVCVCVFVCLCGGWSTVTNVMKVNVLYLYYLKLLESILRKLQIHRKFQIKFHKLQLWQQKSEDFYDKRFHQRALKKCKDKTSR